MFADRPRIGLDDSQRGEAAAQAGDKGRLALQGHEVAGGAACREQSLGQRAGAGAELEHRAAAAGRQLARHRPRNGPAARQHRSHAERAAKPVAKE
jgi:hypothetical protein